MLFAEFDVLLREYFVKVFTLLCVALGCDADFATGHIDTSFIAARGDALIPSDEPDDLAWGTAATFALQKVRDDDAGLAGFRLNAPSRISVTLSHRETTRKLTDELVLAEATGYTTDEGVLVFHKGTAFQFLKGKRGDGHHHAGDGAILAPMPGKVIAVDVAAGDTVTKGTRLLVLEAMKMEHALTAPFDGILAELTVTAGSQVQVEALLARVEAAKED